MTSATTDRALPPVQTDRFESSAEHAFPAGEMLVSTTDPGGVITHCNEAFARASGHAVDELVGRPHSIVRHPDVPAEVFEDLWRTITEGHPWSGVLKNRRRDGKACWVAANIVPLRRDGRLEGFMSVHALPPPEQVAQAEALYAELARQAAGGRVRVRLVEGKVEPTGLRGAAVRFWRSGVTARLALVVMVTVAIGMLPHWLGLAGPGHAWIQFGALAFGAALQLAWFERRIHANIREAAGFASELAACNLASELREDRYGPLGALPERLRQIQVNLRAVVGDVRQGVEAFTAAAGEISRGSQDLAARTETQVINLQQTAATMELLSNALRDSATAVQEVARHGARTTAVATDGGQAIDRVAATMETISAESRSMRDIVGVIEGIAFQTNILALNAAVEAARAGEQGRGFAVVAAEVRTLAQRSAEAAREIRGLIASSGSQIGDGAEQMGRAADTIREAVVAIRRVGELIDGVARASEQQATGIAQVNEAVAHLDTMTQGNATLAEEYAASAETMAARAGMLRRAVGVFVA
jgi:aerotaxis receptor